jgi:CHAT domain-containing protein
MRTLKQLFGFGRTSANAGAVETSAWSEYVDDEHDFQFQYPAGWVFGSGNLGIFLRPPDARSFLVSDGGQLTEIFSPGLSMTVAGRGNTEGQSRGEIFESVRQHLPGGFPQFLLRGARELELESGEPALEVTFQFSKSGRTMVAILLYVVRCDAILMLDGSVLATDFPLHELVIRASLGSLRAGRRGGSRAAPRIEIRPTPSSAADVLLAVDRFTTAKTVADSRAVLDRHPELLTNADATDRAIARLASSQTTTDARRLIEGYGALLRRCREIGPDRAFVELLPTALSPESRTVIEDSDFAQRHRKAVAAATRHDETLDPIPLDEAVSEWAALIVDPRFESCPVSLRVAILHEGGLALLTRYRRTGDENDLLQALRWLERGVGETAAEPRDRWRVLNVFGAARMERYLRHARDEDLENAMDAFTRCVAEGRRDEAHWSMVLNNLAVTHLLRYERFQDVDDLSRAITIWQEVADTPAPDWKSVAMRLCNLGIGFATRHTHIGNREDLDAAIEKFERAVTLDASNSPDAVSYRHNLAGALYSRFVALGRLADLDRAIEIQRAAIEVTPESSTDLAPRLNQLGTLLVARADRFHTLADLDWAIAAWKKALEMTQRGAAVFAEIGNNLGGGYDSRFDLVGDLADLDRAIHFYQLAIEYSPAGSAKRAGRLTNLSTVLRTRFKRKQIEQDLQRAVELAEAAVAEESPTSIRYAGCLNNLGNALETRFEWLHSSSDLEGALWAFQRASELARRFSSEESFRSSSNWGRLAFAQRDWQQAARAFAEALEAGERLWRVQAAREQKESWLQGMQGASSLAAFSLAKSGDLLGAVQALEQGRARLLSEALEYDRSDLQSLESIDPPSLMTYRTAAERVAYLERQGRYSVQSPEFRKASDDLDAAVTAIRELPGFAEFLSPRHPDAVAETFASHDRAAALVYICATTAGSLALIVSDPNRVNYVWLTLTQLQLDALLFGNEERSGYLVDQLRRNLRFRQQLPALLDELGETLIQPLADRLRSLGVRRVYLVACGRLAILPLHAARYRSSGARTWFLDEFVVSYVPNARALALARRTALERNGEFRLVGIGNPLPGALPLPAAQAELEEIESLPAASDAITLYAEQATRAALLRQIGAATHLHFACHGMFDLAKPLQSHLVLSGQDRLTLRDLLYGDAHPGKARLVVLSACRSAIIDFKNLPDEIVGLSLGFLQAGVPGVVGTLWAVDDLSTALVMVRFYELLAEAATTAEALSKAQRWLRDLTVRELNRFLQAHPKISHVWTELGPKIDKEKPFAEAPYAWAPFVFIGA